MEQQFKEFLEQEADRNRNPENRHPDFVDADNQTVVSEVTLFRDASSLFRGPLYHDPRELQDDVPEQDINIDSLFANNNRKPASDLPEVEERSRKTSISRDILPEDKQKLKTIPPEEISSRQQKTITGKHSGACTSTQKPPFPVAPDAEMQGEKCPGDKKEMEGEGEGIEHKSGDNSHDNVTTLQDWMQDMQAGIQDMPSSPPARRTPAPELQYNNRGNVLKSSFAKNYSGPRPGAYPQGPYWRPSASTQCQSPILEEGENQPADLEEANGVAGECNAVVAKATPRPRCNKWVLVGTGFVLVLLVALCVVIPMVVLQNKSSKEDPPQDNLASEEEIGLTLVVPNMTNATIKALEDPHSPQGRAYDWVFKDPNWDTFEDWRKQQRFALACLIHATGMEGVHTQDFGYYTTECRWIRGQGMCNDDGQVTILNVGSFRSMDSIGGHVPAEMALLPKLQSIDFSGFTILVDTVEDLLPLDTHNSLSSLQELKLSDCDLRGSIPSTLGLLTSLTSLDLSMNELTSTIPSELALLSNLSSLLLQSNDLSGSIPEEIGDLSSLAMLHTEGNIGVEILMPEGLCTEDHRTLEEVQTDWCSDPAGCCSS